MSFSGAETTEKGFAKGWDPDAQDQEQQRLFRLTQILEAALFRPFAWKPHSSMGLRYAYYGGWVEAGGGWAFAPDGTVTLGDSVLNFVERSAAGVVTVNPTGFSAGAIPMAQIRCANGAALPRTYIDCRPFLGASDGGGGGGGSITFMQIVGQILNAQVPSSAVTQHQAALAINFAQMVGQIAPSQVPVGAVTQHQAALSLLFTQLTDQIADDQVPASAVLQHLGMVFANLQQIFEDIGFLMAKATSTRPETPMAKLYAYANFA